MLNAFKGFWLVLEIFGLCSALVSLNLSTLSINHCWEVGHLWPRYCDEQNCKFEALVAACGSIKPTIKPADSVEALQTLQTNSLKALSKQSSQNSLKAKLSKLSKQSSQNSFKAKRKIICANEPCTFFCATFCDAVLFSLQTTNRLAQLQNRQLSYAITHFTTPQCPETQRPFHEVGPFCFPCSFGIVRLCSAEGKHSNWIGCVQYWIGSATDHNKAPVHMHH